MAEAGLAREKIQLKAHYEDLTQRLQNEISHQKVLLAEHQQRLDEQYQRSKAVLTDDFLKKEKALGDEMGEEGSAAREKI